MRIDLAGWSREATVGDHPAFLALFEEADALGYDGVWFHEFRLQAEPWPYPCPLLLAAAVLARTQRLRVGTSVLVTPLHQPLLLAEQVLQLQFQSGRRFDAGLGRGTDATTLERLGLSRDGTRHRFEEATVALKVALEREGIAGLGAALPLYLAASSTESIAFAVGQTLPLLLSLEPPEGLQLQRLDEACRAMQGLARDGARTEVPGQAPGWTDAEANQGPQADAPTTSRADARTLRRQSAISRYVVIGESAAEAAQQLEALWPRLWQRRLYFAAKRGQHEAEVPPLDIARALREQFIHGSPDQCLAGIRDLYQQTGVGHLRLVFNANGLWSWTQALAGIRRFARTILAEVRGIGEIGEIGEIDEIRTSD